MDTPRQLVYKTLEYKKPERIPMQVWDLPWTYSHFPKEIKELNEKYPCDIIWCPSMLKGKCNTKGDPYTIGSYTDEWGCVFENKFEGIIGEVKQPQIICDDWEDIKNIAIPLELTDVDVTKINNFCRNTEKFVLSSTSVRIFERMQFLGGTEKTLMDLMYCTSGFMQAIEKVHDFFCKELEAWAKTDVDGLFIQDDWGTQFSMLISPTIWEKVFKPLYADYSKISKRYNKKLFMHSDGYILEIIPHLIDIGVDALNSQIFCMGLENLQKFKGCITFWGEIDRQKILPFGTSKDVQDAVKMVKDTLWANGGCIAQCDFGLGVNPKNVLKVFETWEEII